MGVFVSEDRSVYRRWVNIIPSLILPGSAQFLSGSRRMGVTWFLASIGVVGLFAFLYFSPFIKAAMPAYVVRIVSDCLHVIIILDSFRKPIPRLKIRTWAALGFLGIVVPVLALLAVRQFLLHPFGMPTEAMQPTLMGNRKTADGRTVVGDHFLVNKLVYRLHEPKRGDLVVFRTDGIEASRREQFSVVGNTIFVKRLVGLPGERISIRPPYVYINGEKLLQPTIFETISSGRDGFAGFLDADLSGKGREKITLGPDEYYVLGDNTRNSLDSRYFGPIDRKSIIGKVGWIYFPPERRGVPQ